MQVTTLDQSVKPVNTLLKLTFGIVPIVAGLDKFTGLLTDWSSYVPPVVANLLPFSAHVLMMIIGIIEITAGIIVLRKPAVGGIIVAAWLTVIGLLLLLSGTHFDVAVRDFVMAIAAYSMARLAKFA
jgi:hypothetical protein